MFKIKTTVIYNSAELQDIPVLIELRKAYLAEDYGSLTEEQITKLEKQLPDYYSRHLGQDLFVYTARDNSEIVSCCFLLVTEKPANPSFLSGLTGSVLNVYTKPGHRRKGHAYKLMESMLADANKMGLAFVELKATESGYELYRRLGFKNEVSHYTNMKFILE